MRQKVNLVVNLVTPEAQALELAKSELKRKGEDSLMGRGRKTATMDWNSLRCLRMNRKQLYNMLIGYQVAICGSLYSTKRKICNFEYGHQPRSWGTLGDILFH